MAAFVPPTCNLPRAGKGAACAVGRVAAVMPAAARPASAKVVMRDMAQFSVG
jgi:hypothetical protein